MCLETTTTERPWMKKVKEEMNCIVKVKKISQTEKISKKKKKLDGPSLRRDPELLVERVKRHKASEDKL